VSTVDIVGHIKELLVDDADGSRIVLGPENIRFLDLAEGTDKLKTLGRWKVEISSNRANLEPVSRVVEILPLPEEMADSGAQSAL
jgi:hypothetical protein